MTVSVKQIEYKDTHKEVCTNCVSATHSFEDTQLKCHSVIQMIRPTLLFPILLFEGREKGVGGRQGYKEKVSVNLLKRYV